ncbi:MAG: SAM-dependent methyltransferase [Desulfobacteraceae bacterium]|jgi:hypothetical protein|nr:MAG: SAM-dependent methyltransferase [Desulfobacteraceae bacterium]
MNAEKGSFRDPFGRVFRKDGKVYRSVFSPGARAFETARNAGIFDKLIGAGLLIPHEEIQNFESAPPGTVYSLRHPELPMVSYPWEWSFSMLKDAALLHLEIMEFLLPLGFWLRDASAFNVQFDGNRLRLIDTLSIGMRVPNSPWIAYGQFCSHFLAPLSLAAYCDIRTLSLWRNYIDGYPLDLAASLLPSTRKYRLGLFMHIVLHSKFQVMADRKEDISKDPSKQKTAVSDKGLLGVVRSLRRTIEKINWKSVSRIWSDYDSIRTYSDDDLQKKRRFIDDCVSRLTPKIVWDLGANRGEFSHLASKDGSFVVSIDGDPACTEHSYKVFVGDKRLPILPLTMDLANPSPGLGWDCSERLGLRDRGPADLVLALALIHHLVLSACIPMPLIASWLGSLGKYLVIEFVPPTDVMVKRLLAGRNGEHLSYDNDSFKSSFSILFDFLDEVKLNNQRVLFFCKNKNS